MVPLGIFMMRNAFNSIPKSLREVAILEGSNDFKIFLTVLMPLAIPESNCYCFCDVCIVE